MRTSNENTIVFGMKIQAYINENPRIYEVHILGAQNLTCAKTGNGLKRY